MIGCLLVAATIGLMMGWLLRSFATSEKRQQLSEIATRLRGREHELDTLNHELKVRTSAVQMLEGKMITSEAALKDLTADLATKVEQLSTLQSEVREKGVHLHAAERERDPLRRELEEAEARLQAQSTGFAEMQTQMENAEDVLVSRDQEIATLKTWVEQLAPKDAEIARLRARTEELEPFQERTRRLEKDLEQDRSRASAMIQGKDQELARHQTHIREMESELARLRTQNQEDLTRFTETLQQRDQDIQRLRVTVEELEVFRGEVEKKELALREAEERRVMDVSEREEEIGALRKRLVEYRVAQRHHTQAKSTNPGEAASHSASAAGRGAGKSRAAQKDDLKQIHGIGPVMERVLNRMGMFTFRQIAEWKDQDVEHMASELNTFPDRIRHDNWIDGAKEQHFLKYGEEL
jgi:predicted flap endonuclease-1-like 5' DNA nuclease/archaellum component FlaC